MNYLTIPQEDGTNLVVCKQDGEVLLRGKEKYPQEEMNLVVDKHAKENHVH